MSCSAITAPYNPSNGYGISAKLFGAMALTNAEKQKAHRNRVNALRHEAARLHALLEHEAKMGNPLALRLTGATNAETVSRVADDLKQRISAQATA